MLHRLNSMAADVWGPYGPEPGEIVEVLDYQGGLLDTDAEQWYFRRVGDRGERFIGYDFMFDEVEW